MSDTFKAILLNQSGDNFTREVKILDKNFLKTGEVLIKIDYSNLNFKDVEVINDKMGKPYYVKNKKITKLVQKNF